MNAKLQATIGLVVAGLLIIYLLVGKWLGIAKGVKDAIFGEDVDEDILKSPAFSTDAKYIDYKKTKTAEMIGKDVANVYHAFKEQFWKNDDEEKAFEILGKYTLMGDSAWFARTFQALFKLNFKTWIINRLSGKERERLFLIMKQIK